MLKAPPPSEPAAAEGTPAPRTAGGGCSRRAEESRKGRDPGLGVTLPFIPGGTPEHLRHPPRKDRAGVRAGGTSLGLAFHVSPLIRSLSICNSSPSPFHLLLVSWCFVFVFLRPCNLTFHHSSRGKTSEVVFLWKYISIIYIYILQISRSAPNPAGQERILAKGFRLLFLLPRGSGLFLLPLDLGWGEKKKKKKMLLKNTE